MRPETSDSFVSVGETMVAFTSRDGSSRYQAVAAGAESNVATTMARLGFSARWVSRLGDDPLGKLIEEMVGEAGVDVDVVRDASRPTGVMTKHITEHGTRSQYYRTGSAASALSPDDVERIGNATLVHVTGITPALSPTAAALVEAIVGPNGWRVSFDFNYRPALWPSAETAAGVLLNLGRQADIVFIGEDEAEALYGTADSGSVSDLILNRHDQELVMKRGAEGASMLSGDGELWMPALRSDLVDPTGAGDAFAAGYLAGHRFGWSADARLQLGHLMGSRVVGVIEDVPPALAPEEREALSPETLARLWR